MQSLCRIHLTNNRKNLHPVMYQSPLNAATKIFKVRKAVYQPLISLREDKFILVLESMNISDPPRDKQYCLGCSVCHCQRIPNSIITAHTPCLADVAWSAIKFNATWFAFSLQCPLGLVLYIYFPANRPLLWQMSIHR